MSRRNQGNNNSNPSVATTAATVAIGAAVGYGAYKLFESMFGSNEPHQNQSNTVAQQQSPPYSFLQKDIFVIDAVEKFRYSFKQLKLHCEEYNVLGFDCEWVSRWGSRQPVALLQLSTHRGMCVLIQLSQLRHIPSELKSLLEDVSIVKVGVAPYTDANFLYKDYGVHVASTLDLRFMAHAARHPPGGLEKMSEDYLGLSLDKSASLQCSDWEAANLSSDQIEYAAKDVHAAFGLFKYFADQIAPGRSSNDIISNYCLEYIDKNYGPPMN
ncbi:exonuclease 3'-5' domain-containing protein 2-like isoform X2 [Sitodiplosis mosellana]|uniref:exonuclease 3'-5' domain-containing protein 2-like isoform X2 n=1 Tax=Sitodiplosis mosellana TaxID=263140 RepID=UPI002443CC44|nr:exonuclease 3'-5' domain-containing protein 2-like isoform X2 [Sitodiplosis mosellana]